MGVEVGCVFRGLSMQHICFTMLRCTIDDVVYPRVLAHFDPGICNICNPNTRVYLLCRGASISYVQTVSGGLVRFQE